LASSASTLFVVPILAAALAGCGDEALKGPGSTSSTGSTGSTGNGGSTGSGGNTSSTSVTSTTTGCGSAAAHCVANQQGCVMGPSGPTCQACPTAHYADSTGACQPVTGTPLEHTFPDQTTMPGQEVTGLCRSWTLNNDTELWVSAVELTQTELSHHSNWVFVPDTVYPGPDGIFPCASRGYDFYKGVGYGGLLYAQSTQATHEVQHFAGGAAIKVLPHARILSDIHMLNTSSMANTGHADLTLYTVPAADVNVRLTAFHVEYDALTIPPQATSQFTAHCSVASDVANVQGTPFAPKVYYVLPHTHTLGSGFFAQVMGGPHDGESLLNLPGFNGEAHGRTFDPPIDMTGADGFLFTCQYTNPRTTTVGWGFGTDEMCEMFGFGETPDFFQSAVSTGSPNGTNSTGVQLFTGNCNTTVIPAPQ
jgi:hypothetical protein